jgi:hypothetical protein
MKIIRLAAQKVNNSLSDLLGVRIIRDPQDAYDRQHKAEALRAVQTIEKYNGKKLSTHLRRIADDYAVQVLGGKAYAPWLYVYALMSDGFKEGWIPDNFFGRFIATKNFPGVAQFKTLSNLVLKTTALPDVAYYIDGIFYNREFKATDAAAVRRAIAGTIPSIFAKKDQSGRG